MSRTIPMDQPLTWADRLYLADRGSYGESLITRLDDAYPPSEKDAERWANRNAPGLNLTGDAALADENARLKALLAEHEIPLPGEEPDDVEYDNRPYSEWKVGELKDELRNRGLAVSGTQPELIERLEADDAAAKG